MKCPTCGNEKLNRQVNGIRDTAIGITLFLTNQCMRCGTVFGTIAEYELKREIISIVDTEKIDGNRSESEAKKEAESKK